MIYFQLDREQQYGFCYGIKVHAYDTLTGESETFPPDCQPTTRLQQLWQDTSG